ncbi:MAG TPA: hypothetical protein VMS55_26675 [Myxococcota bacterium]|nr:hypothetical protein [Myxococcota bacterium]
MDAIYGSDGAATSGALHRSRVTSYRKRRLEPWSQRLRRIERSLLGGSGKSQRVYRVTIAGRDVKQIVFADSARAERTAALLDALADTGLVPRRIARHGSELWVEFLEGVALDPAAPAPMDELAALFATFYTRGPRSPADPAPLRAEVAAQLGWLRDFGVLDPALARALEARALSTPATGLSHGLDYLDARPDNFLRDASGRLRIVDLESVGADELQGTGAARAWLRWPGVSRDALLAGIARCGGPDLAPAADFLELRFAAGWTLRSLLLRKPKLVDPALFRRLASG